MSFFENCFSAVDTPNGIICTSCATGYYPIFLGYWLNYCINSNSSFLKNSTGSIVPANCELFDKSTSKCLKCSSGLYLIPDNSTNSCANTCPANKTIYGI